MKTFLLIAHGSRRAASNDEVRALAQRIADQADGQFDQLACCFLELADPLIPDAIAELAQAGARHITIFPYFLAVGAHVAEDIPEAIEAAREHYPEITFNVLPHLGEIPTMPRLILQQLES
ncbi:MAG: cobalamin biosynthesis protein CbiX [Kiritimatiellaceae bacterium]|nr:MAG: cobalamin biosynthesis protein CbiX [Kiritimatiellaceae bacterium]|tara:strand:- start:5706 stop:6068 length:363 start_codon:yes stop_codon:yes gene_type:complete